MKNNYRARFSKKKWFGALGVKMCPKMGKKWPFAQLLEIFSRICLYIEYLTRGRCFLTIPLKKFFQKKCLAPFLGAFRGRFCENLLMAHCTPYWLMRSFAILYVFVLITGWYVSHIWCCIISGLILYWAIEKWKLKKKNF